MTSSTPVHATRRQEAVQDRVGSDAAPREVESYDHDPGERHGASTAVVEGATSAHDLGGEFVAVNDAALSESPLSSLHSPQTGHALAHRLPPQSNDLKDQSGNATNISLSFSSPDGESFFSGSGLTASTIPIYTPSLASLNGNVDSTVVGSTFNAAFSGLVPDSVYDIWVFSARFTGETSQTVTITGEGAPTVFTQDAPEKSLAVNSLVGSNTEPLSFYAIPIEASASGDISISITGTQLRGYGVSGFAIQAVPEPTSFTLAGIGIAVMVGYGWWRRKLAAA